MTFIEEKTEEKIEDKFGKNISLRLGQLLNRHVDYQIIDNAEAWTSGRNKYMIEFDWRIYGTSIYCRQGFGADALRQICEDEKWIDYFCQKMYRKLIEEYPIFQPVDYLSKGQIRDLTKLDHYFKFKAGFASWNPGFRLIDSFKAVKAKGFATEGDIYELLSFGLRLSASLDQLITDENRVPFKDYSEWVFSHLPLTNANT